MNVSLTPELEAMVEEKVKSGEYRSASEVVREALRLFRQREEEHRARLEALRGKIQVGLDDLEEGRRIPGDEAFENIRQRRREAREPVLRQ